MPWSRACAPRRIGDLGIGQARVRRHQNPPERGGADEDEPLLRIGDVGDVREVRHRLAVVVGGRERQEHLGDGHALHLRADGAPRHGAEPVRADAVAPLEDAGGPVGMGDGDRNAGLGLGHGGGRRRIVDGDVRDVLQPRVQHLRQAPLLALQPVGVIRVAGQKPQIEGGDHAAAPVAELPGRTDETDRDHPVDDAESLEHVERRWMEGRGAQIARQIRRAFDERDRNSGVREQGCGHQPDRPRADDDDPIRLRRRHARPPLTVRSPAQPTCPDKIRVRRPLGKGATGRSPDATRGPRRCVIRSCPCPIAASSSGRTAPASPSSSPSIWNTGT